MNVNVVNKKLINEVDKCVDEALRGIACLYPKLQLHEEYRFISTTQDVVSDKVAIMSGGGSGHEPFCSGYVGLGMLDGAVAGSVFASPPRSNLLYGIEHLHRYNKGGVLVIIANYTGDRLNFGMAVEKARNSGLKVESLVVGEDCASDNDTGMGRRGMCGLLFIYKLSGALANDGHDMETIIKTLHSVLKNLSTLGITLRPCSLPGQPPLFHISDDEMVLGTGVHGENGIESLKLGSAKDAVHIILEKLCNHLHLKAGSKLAILINNLGTTSQIEQNIITAEVYQQLVDRGMIIERIYAGMLMTSLDMAGFQVSILNIPSESEDWLDLLDATTHAPKWVGSSASVPNRANTRDTVPENRHNSEEKKSVGVILDEKNQRIFKKCLRGVAESLIKNENHLNVLDAGCGDGDCGTTLRHLGDGILESLPKLNLQSPSSVLLKLSDLAESVMGGTSGALYGIGFTAAAKSFSRENSSNLFELWTESLNEAVSSIMKYGGARLGDRTMVDALVPAAQALKEDRNALKALKKAAEAAEIGSKLTQAMKARAGRAAYVNPALVVDVDAGAFAVATWFACLLVALE